MQALDEIMTTSFCRFWTVELPGPIVNFCQVSLCGGLSGRSQDQAEV
jgi:hypothetical protein